MLHFNEDTRVKFPATVQFMRLGYSYQSLKGANIDFETKIFRDRFKTALEKINNRTIEQDEITRLLGDLNLMLKNNDLGKEFYNRLISTEHDIKLIDFDDIYNNDFAVVDELPFSVKEGTEEWFKSYNILNQHLISLEMEELDMLVKLGDIAEVLISNVDKKSKPNEKEIKLCNFVDVYKNYAITDRMTSSFMVATASNQSIEKFTIKKGYLAITKDSETRDDIGVGTYFADDFDNLLLGYHCALIKPNNKLVYSKYLNAFIQSNFVRKYYELNASGSGQRYTLTLESILSTPILLPDYDKQVLIETTKISLASNLFSNSLNKGLLTLVPVYCSSIIMAEEYLLKISFF